jgi:hypothetical protein
MNSKHLTRNDELKCTIIIFLRKISADYIHQKVSFFASFALCDFLYELFSLATSYMPEV